MKKELFYPGQRVKQYDTEDDCWVYGHVKEIKDKSVIIKWGDITDPCEHFEDEFPTIKEGLPHINH